jgi:transcription antitermination factor NusG
MPHVTTATDKTLILVQVLPQQAQRVARDLRQSGVRVNVPREQYSAASTSKKFRSFGYLAMDRAPDIQHGVKAVGHSESDAGITFEPITLEPPAITRRTVGRVQKRALTEFYINDRRHANKGRHARREAAAPTVYSVGDHVVILTGALEGTNGTVSKILGKRLVVDVTILGKPCNPVTFKASDVRKV